MRTSIRLCARVRSSRGSIPATYQSELEAAQAAVAQAQAEAARMSTVLADATSKFSRARELAADDLIPAAELETAGATMAQAAADLRKSQADIRVAQSLADQAQVSLSRTVIRSPIDGVVVNRNVSVGQTVAVRLEPAVLFTIADLRKMKLLVEIDEGEVGGVGPGTPVTFQVESIGPLVYQGTVADVRLQPYMEQTAVATAGTTSGSAGQATPTATASSSASNRASSTGVAAASPTAGAASAGRATSTSTATATAPAASSGSSSSSGPAAPGVVTYTAVIDVNNDQGSLTPGGTAIVNLSGSQRNGVVRIPNNALSFRPDRALLERIGQQEPEPDTVSLSGTDDANRRQRIAYVWQYDGRKFTRVAVEIGLADDQWTELLSGPIQPGDQLVTRASVAGGAQ